MAFSDFFLQSKMTFNDDEPIVEDDSGEKPEPNVAGKTSLRIINKNVAPLEESKFKVTLELTGAGSGNDRRGLDLVMVLDVSESMDGDKLKKMIIDTQFLIKKLSPIDRMSVVTFAKNSTRLCPLRQITEHSQAQIGILVEALLVKRGTNIAAGLQTGLQVLNDRTHTRERAVGIILMSYGLQTDGDATKVPVGKVPVHTFRYSQDHDPKVLKAIADNSFGGTFSDVQNEDNLSIAFSKFLGGLLGVVVQDLKLTVSKMESTIKEVSAGNYPKCRDATADSVTISFGNLYIKELRKVVVDLLLPAVNSKVTTDVLEINYTYSGEEKRFEANPLWTNITRIETFMEPEREEEVMIEKNRGQTARAMAIVLNSGISIGVSNNTSQESDVVVVNFSTFWEFRLGRYGTYPYRTISEPPNPEINGPIFKTMVMADEKTLEDGQEKLFVQAENLLEEVNNHQNAASSSSTTNENDQHGEAPPPSFETMLDNDLNFVNSAWKKYTGRMNVKIYVASKEFKRLRNLGSIEKEKDFDKLREAMAELKSQIKQLENNHQNGASSSETTKKNDQHGEREAPPSSETIRNDLRLVKVAWKKYTDHMNAKISMASKEFKRLQRKYPVHMNAQISVARGEFKKRDFYKAIENLTSQVKQLQSHLTSNEDDHDGGALYQKIGSELNLLASAFDEAKKFQEIDFEKIQKAIENLKSQVKQAEKLQIHLTSNEDDHDGGTLYQKIGSELNLLASAFVEAKKFQETDFEKIHKAIEKLKSTCFDEFQNAIANLTSQVKKLQSRLTSNKDDHDGGALSKMFGSEEAEKFLKSTGGEINHASAKSNEPQKANSEKPQKVESSKLRKDIGKLRDLIRSYGEISSTDSNRQPNEWPDINGVGEGRMRFFFQESNEPNTEGVDVDKMMDKFTKLNEPEQHCLLCFFKFPPKEFIRRTTMIYLWIGQGYILQEDAGKKIFDELITNGFIERSSLEANSCKMNPSAQSSLYKAAEDKGFTPNGTRDLDAESVRVKQIGHSCLINVGEAIINCKPEIFGKMEHIRSLYLGRWRTSATHHIELADTKILHGMRKLNNLTFLSLRGISLITELPKFISELNALKILDLRACHNLEAIPDEISSLKELTHLDMSECYFLDHMPKSLAQLSNLEVLKGFFIGEFKKNKPTCTLKDLSRMLKLGKLNIYTSVKNFPDMSDLEALKEFKVLQKLTISWGGCSSAGKIVDKTASACRAEGEQILHLGLQKLDLQGFPLRCLPYWLRPSNLKELRKLYIRGGNLRDLGQLSENKGEHWNVEILHLKFLDALEINWSKLMILFPKLIYLHPKECSKLNFKGYERSVWSEWKGEESSVWMDKKAIDARFWLHKIFRSHGVSLSSLLGYDPVD